MLGTPMPRMTKVIMVKNRVRSKLRSPILMMAAAMLRPMPVLLMTPTTMPTQAQAEAATGDVTKGGSGEALANRARERARNAAEVK